VGSQGFTLIELLVVLVIVAIGAALVTVALPDRTQDRLNEDAERLERLEEEGLARRVVADAELDMVKHALSRYAWPGA